MPDQQSATASRPPRSPKQRYLDDLKRPEFSEDAAQAEAVSLLERVYQDLLQAPQKPAKSGLRARFRRSKRTRWPAVQGAYLWGGVGRGKTYLMDAFFEALPFAEKRRTHFHRFMADVHARRAKLSDQQDPLDLIAEDLASESRVLCFDEFFVSDIADAMILGRLTECLFGRGVTLVATSNCSPDMLYRGGLQRARFEPAIAKLQQHCTVLNVDGGTDYRMRALEGQPLYGVGERAHDGFDAAVSKLDPAKPIADTHISIHNRDIPVRLLGESTAWFDFDALCCGPRSAHDYIELATEFPWILLSHVPQLTVELENEARRFITLVDECYDRSVKLMVAAAVPMVDLYAGSKLKFEFERTLSRLTEMQSDDYLARPHLADMST